MTDCGVIIFLTFVSIKREIIIIMEYCFKLIFFFVPIVMRFNYPTCKKAPCETEGETTDSRREMERGNPTKS